MRDGPDFRHQTRFAGRAVAILGVGLAACALCALSAGATTLGVRGTQFTLDGKPTFLLGVSYYAAIGVTKDVWKPDLDELQRHGINWIRVWATWAAFDNDISAVDGDGNPREPYLGQLRHLVAECNRRGIVVDVTLTRGSGERGSPKLPDLAAHIRAVETLVVGLKRWRNWYIDLSNERNIRDARYTSFEDLARLRDAVKRLDRGRLVTASQGGDISKDELRDYLLTARLDLVCPHRPRDASSAAQTEAVTRDLLGWMREIGRVVPVHYQEPFRRGYGDWQPSAKDFEADLDGARKGAAAGWCFHNGSTRQGQSGRPRRSFDLRDGPLFRQLDSEEHRFLVHLASVAPYHAAVRVSRRVVNTVRAEVFGDNIEWTNDGMGFWLPATAGFDESLVLELKQAGVTHLRYPGGTLSDYFDWEKATGENRAPQPNPFEKGRTQRPDFGPAEFMKLCRRLGVPGMITLNAGTGTPELAAGWVDYCRRHRFSVNAFEVGNEIYMADPKNESIPATPIAKTPQQYADFFLRVRALVDRSAPGTPLGAIGLLDTGTFPLNRQPDWLKVILTRIGPRMDFLAVHNGYATAMRASGFGARATRVSDDEYARSLLGASQYVRDNLRATEALIARYAPPARKDLPIHITEHGPLVYPIDPAHAVEDAKWNTSLAGALYLAGLYNVILCDPHVTSANHLPLCQDVFGALIGIHGAGPNRRTWRNIVFYVFQQYARMAGRKVLQTEVSCPSYATLAAGIVPALKGVPSLDAAAFSDPSGKQTSMFLVNRDVDRDALVTVRAPGMKMVAVTSLSADSYVAANSAERPTEVVPMRKVLLPTFVSSDVRVPKHSLAVVELVRSSAAGEPRGPASRTRRSR